MLLSQQKKKKKRKRKKLWSFSLVFFTSQSKLQPLAFQLGSVLCPGWRRHSRLLTWKRAEQEPHHGQKHSGPSVGRAQEQNANHTSCLGRNSFCLLVAHNELSCLSFWHVWCHRLPRDLIPFRCLLLNELIFWGAAIYWFIAGSHLQHMIFSHHGPGNSLHLKPRATARMLTQPSCCRNYVKME